MEEDRTEIIETRPTARDVREVRETDATPHVTEVRSAVAPRADMDRVESFAYDPFQSRRLAALRVTQLVYWVFGLVEGLIAIRFVLKALGANPSAGFAEFIYGVTAPLVAPFSNLFANPASEASVLELNSLIALVVYALVAYLLARLVWILVGETRTGVKTHSTKMDTRA
jgi:YggT family protein